MVLQKDGIVYSLFFLFISICTVSKAQDFGRPLEPLSHEMLVVLPQDSLRAMDTGKLLNHDFSGYENEIHTLFWKNKHWFFFIPAYCKDPHGSWNMELFCYNPAQRKIYQMTSAHISFSTEHNDDLMIYDDKIIIHAACNFVPDGEWKSEFIIVEPDKPLSGKCVFLRGMSYQKGYYTKDGKLLVLVQPCKRRYNYFSLLNPILHDKEPKWFYEDKGKMWRYMLNNKIEIIEAAEIE